MMGDYFLGHMFGWNMWSDSLMLLVWTGIIFFVIWLTIQAATGKLSSHPGSALDILKERYAKGEINKEEFEEKKKELNA